MTGLAPKMTISVSLNVKSCGDSEATTNAKKTDMETSTQKLAHIAFERTSKTNTEQQKPNKQASSQAEQNLRAKP
jgi:hypothetical protein